MGFNLFEDQNLLPFDGEMYYFPQFVSNDFFLKLKSETNWKQEGMKIYGKEILFPRLTAWYADEGKTYKYSGLLNVPLEFTPTLRFLKELIEQKMGVCFNSALLNYYRHGNDSMGWHADNESELGINPIIASLNLGGLRKFQVKHKKEKKTTTNIFLEGGSLLMMQGSMQHHWLHQIPKVKEAQERINITFRTII
jgi:alkylated DNA repair dioxygenase AlkB